MKRELINVGTPPAMPFSHGVKVGDFVFTAGQTGRDPKTGKLVPGGIRAETRQALENLSAILKAAGSSIDRVVKSTVYLVDMAADYAGMNEVYREFIPKDPPARATVEVKGLASSARVEIEFIAIL
jgi:2-iminobutanoate/2-iminopropanoate deaminase